MWWKWKKERKQTKKKWNEKGEIRLTLVKNVVSKWFVCPWTFGGPKAECFVESVWRMDFSLISGNE